MSEEKEIKELAETLDAYKSKISQVNKATLTWDKELIFIGRTNRGYEVEYDAQQQWGCSPTETLLLSVAGCMGIDMRMSSTRLGWMRMRYSPRRSTSFAREAT